MWCVCGVCVCVQGAFVLFVSVCGVSMCVGVCMCVFCNVWVYVCVGFVMF